MHSFVGWITTQGKHSFNYLVSHGGEFHLFVVRIGVFGNRRHRDAMVFFAPIKKQTTFYVLSSKILSNGTFKKMITLSGVHCIVINSDRAKQTSEHWRPAWWTSRGWALRSEQNSLRSWQCPDDRPGIHLTKYWVLFKLKYDNWNFLKREI